MTTDWGWGSFSEEGTTIGAQAVFVDGLVASLLKDRRRGNPRLKCRGGSSGCPGDRVLSMCTRRSSALSPPVSQVEGGVSFLCWERVVVV